ncbi:MAG: type II toxin-antitoxin system VapC family toxin [Candidatus Sumerlaeota bacterium]|nr:type II toxin-antitoxin system VapC family toxin [Candidatus Sumerlaeota bacterium]
MIADSNLLIYAAKPDDIVVYRWLIVELPSVSAISLVEVLGFHRFKPGEREALEELMSALQIIYPTPETFRIAVELRQQRKMSVADSLIAATALEHHEALATHNTADFSKIDKLVLFDPLTGDKI